MPIVSVRIPQIGEGLQEARLVAFLKQPGEKVSRDEPIYQMETDKAVMDVESPFDGVLVEWLAPIDAIVPIGGEVARMETSVSEVETQTPETTTETLTSLRIPQIGEGLQEARLVAVLKQPGDQIKRDEPIYQMETDKAVMDVESPFEGVLVEWLGKVDEVLSIGAEVGRMRVLGEVTEMVVHGAPNAAPVLEATTAGPMTSAPRNANIPPRTRAYAKEKGVSDEVLNSISSASGKLMPGDIDAYLLAGEKQVDSAYAESPIAQKQRLLASRLVRGNQLVVPGTITVATNWEPIEKRRAAYKAMGGDFQPSTFTLFAYAVAQTMKDFPAFRSSLVGDSTVRTYHHIALGIAVSLPGDELVIAVVEDADALDWPGFAQRTREKIELARQGKDQANQSVTLSLTNMQNAGLRDAVPVVVPPSVATLFLGEIYNSLAQGTTELKMQRTANLAMTFDHRLINGVGAAQFINDIKAKIESIDELIP